MSIINIFAVSLFHFSLHLLSPHEVSDSSTLRTSSLLQCIITLTPDLRVRVILHTLLVVEGRVTGNSVQELLQ